MFQYTCLNPIAQVGLDVFTEEYKKLLINGIDVNIPCGLSRDLCAALKYADCARHWGNGGCVQR